MTFDYTKDTKHHYKSDEIAKAYHDQYAHPRGVKGLRFRFIAWRERKAVRELLSRVSHGRVLDIPAGTGKMAPIFAAMGCTVTPCDVSENMLALAKASYTEAGCHVEAFHVVDLEAASTTLDQTYDAVVCVRLMHRVPDDVKARMLGEISRLAPNAVVSFGVEGGYYELLGRAIRRASLGGLDAGVETRGDLESVMRLVCSDFDLVHGSPIAKGLSAEWMFLLRSKNFQGRPVA